MPGNRDCVHFFGCVNKVKFVLMIKVGEDSEGGGDSEKILETCNRL